MKKLITAILVAVLASCQLSPAHAELPRVPNAPDCIQLGDVAVSTRALVIGGVAAPQAAVVLREMYDQFPAGLVEYLPVLFKHATTDKRTAAQYGLAFATACIRGQGDASAFFGEKV